MRERAPPSLKRNHVIPSDTKRTAMALMMSAISETEVWDKSPRPVKEAWLTLFKDLEV